MTTLLEWSAKAGLVAIFVGSIVVFAAGWAQEQVLRNVTQASGSALNTRSADADAIRTQLEGYRLQLAAYQTQVDTLKWLVGIVIGLSSLYALVIGTTAYLNVQHLVERTKEQSKRVDDIRQELEKKSPALTSLGIAVDRIRERLNTLLPNSKEREQYFEQLSENEKQEILLSERLVGFYAHADEPAEAISEIYRGLGKFYNARFRTAVASAPVTSKQRRRDKLRDDLERARFYLGIALRKYSKNFAAHNDLGVVLLDLASLTGADRDGLVRDAERAFRESLRIQPDQQRAHYDLARTLYDQKKFAEAEKLLSIALTQPTWQGEANEARRRDILYNRACFRSRRAAINDKRALADQALDDLKSACTPMTRDTAAYVLADVEEGGDLVWLAGVFPDEVGRLKDEAARVARNPDDNTG